MGTKLRLIGPLGKAVLAGCLLMKRDKQLTNFKTWRNFFNFASKQYKVLIPKFLEYYRFDFHPNQTDEKALVAATKVKLGISDRSPLLS
ncbi:hypothetical protein AbD4_02243 [Acinetobacter baumannii]|nr:hypothetical protein AbD4_02243 [Acinetobacter baumannii]